MTQSNDPSGGTLAQQMFGPQAGVYAQSKVHISDDSLESVQKLTASEFRRATTPYRWTVDIGTGAGFTAFAMADVSDRVVASDITQPMLRQAQPHQRRARAAQRPAGPERSRVPSLRQRQPGPDHLPQGGPPLPGLRGVTGRDAANSQSRAGSLVMADTVAPEDSALGRVAERG